MAEIHESYDEAKRRSAEIDLELGFETERIERTIKDSTPARITEGGTSPETWNHLSPQIFQTPYSELETMVNQVDPELRFQTWVDIGAGYGRLGIILARLRPRARFLGLEVVRERVIEGQRIYKKLGIDPKSLRCEDVNKTPLPSAELYFIYDFGHRSAIDSLLIKLQSAARQAPITVVGRGRGIRDAIEREHPWLSSVNQPRHEAHYSIYAS